MLEKPEERLSHKLTSLRPSIRMGIIQDSNHTSHQATLQLARRATSFSQRVLHNTCREMTPKHSIGKLQATFVDYKKALDLVNREMLRNNLDGIVGIN